MIIVKGRSKGIVKERKRKRGREELLYLPTDFFLHSFLFIGLSIYYCPDKVQSIKSINTKILKTESQVKDEYREDKS